MTERFDIIACEYIDFVNEMVGSYMDAVAGLRGCFTRIEQQIHRVSRSTGKQIENGEAVVVGTSYEGPAKLDIIKVVEIMFPAGEVIFVSYDAMHKLFVLIKQDCAKLMMGWLRGKDAPISPEIVYIAIQRAGA